MPPLFDRSFLPPALCEFAVLADTHYLPEGGSGLGEFASRGLQSARARAALQRAAALQTDFAVHLGDLVQEYPGAPLFERALDEALEQLRQSGLQARLVAGNHDVGDKPDPTMPTHPVGAESLEAFHRRFGPSWYSFECRDLHLIVLNAQIMNTGLPEEAAQRAWFEADLEAHRQRRLFLFLHLPPFLWDADEPHLGHYDNVGEPARAWLLEQVRAYRVEMLFAAHVHFAFCEHLGPTRYLVVPSTSFTRPGFGHLFASAPPPEQGRDDRPKLGFYLCRVRQGRTDVHLVRTGGALDAQEGGQQVLTRVPADLRGAPLGLTLTHPLCPTAEVPLAWPSCIRQRVRNDYPFLACLEAGATAVRAPWTDLQDPLQERRLQALRAEGVQVHIFAPHGAQPDPHHLLDHHPEVADLWEVQLPGSILPDAALLAHVEPLRRRAPVALCPIVPGAKIPGKQHPRTRLGYLPAELEALNRELADRDGRVDAALCRLGEDPWEALLALGAAPPLDRIGRADFLLTLPGRDDAANARLACEALFATALLPGARLFVDPPQDLDRTMDAGHGLLDALCNPRPAFAALRCLNTLLHACGEGGWEHGSTEAERLRILCLTSATHTLHLLLPAGPAAPWPAALPAAGTRLYRLDRAACETPGARLDGPCLLVAPR